MIRKSDVVVLTLRRLENVLVINTFINFPIDVG